MAFEGGGKKPGYTGYVMPLAAGSPKFTPIHVFRATSETVEYVNTNGCIKLIPLDAFHAHCHWVEGGKFRDGSPVQLELLNLDRGTVVVICHSDFRSRVGYISDILVEDEEAEYTVTLLDQFDAFSRSISFDEFEGVMDTDAEEAEDSLSTFLMDDPTFAITKERRDIIGLTKEEIKVHYESLCEFANIPAQWKNFTQMTGGGGKLFLVPKKKQHIIEGIVSSLISNSTA